MTFGAHVNEGKQVCADVQVRKGNARIKQRIKHRVTYLYVVEGCLVGDIIQQEQSWKKRRKVFKVYRLQIHN